MRARLLTLVNQALSSLTNFGGSALAAGLLTATDFGAFAVAVSTLTLALGLTRTWSGMVLMVVAPGADDRRYSAMLSGAVGLAGALGAALGAVAAIVGWALEGAIGDALLVLAPLIPLVTMQDAYRHGALARGDAKSACWNDGIWLALAVLGLMVLRRADHASLALALLLAVGTAAAGVAFAVLRTRIVPRWHDLVSCFAEWRQISIRLSGEFVVAITSNLATLVLITAWNADLEQAGSLRSAQVLFGPLAVIFAASALHAQPIMVRLHRSGRSVFAIARKQTAVNLVVTLCWLAIAISVPDRVGTRVFGASWEGLTDVALVVGLAFIGPAISTGALTALRSRGQINAGLATQSMVAGIILLCTAVGGLLFADGTLRGFAVGNIVASGVTWLVLTRWQVRDMVAPSGTGPPVTARSA